MEKEMENFFIRNLNRSLKRKKTRKVKTFKKICSLMLGVLFTTTLLTGCYVPRQSRSSTYSQEQAQEVYGRLDRRIEELLAQPYAYTVEATGEHVEHLDYYQTEEYKVAYLERSSTKSQAGAEYLWYEGAMYCRDNEGKYTWKSAAWEELQADEFTDAAIEYAHTLLQEEPEELRFKSTSDKGKRYYVLEADYPILSMPLEEREVYPHLYAVLDKEGRLNSLSVSWSRPVQDWDKMDADLITVNFRAYEESTSYQAERKIWWVGYELGLCETTVPALTEQQKHHDRCRKIIESMDFKTLQIPSAQDNELEFMSLYPEVWI